jgi:hypothetical protein
VIDLITVVFKKEIPLIEIQARSIELYIDTDRIKNIYVVVNDEDSIVNLIDPRWWGTNSNKVQIIPRSKYGVDSALIGWDSQQMYKLFAAESAESAWSMCLDAKTWFVQELHWDKLFDEQNRVKFRSIPVIPVFKSAQEFLEKFYNIHMKEVIGPGGVPFMFHTETVKSMFKELGTPFLEFFSTHVRFPANITEFMLYSAYIVHKYSNYSSLYSQYQPYMVQNMADFQFDKFDKILEDMNYPVTLTASIHLRVYPLLSDDQFERWFSFLVEKNLTTNIENTKSQLNILRH